MKSIIKLGAAIWIAGRVFRHCAYIDVARADDLRPARGNRKQVRIAEGHVTCWYPRGGEASGGDRNVLISQRRTADPREMLDRNGEPLGYVVVVSDLFEGS